MPKPNIVPNTSLLPQVAVLGVAAFVGTVWTWGQQPDEKLLTIRYVLFGLSALAAFITPYLLFPDRYRQVIQLANPPADFLQEHLREKLNRVFLPVSVMLFFMAVGGLVVGSGTFFDKILSAAGAILFFSGILRLAFYRYTKSGADSQFWSESEKGRRYRKKAADYFKYPLDPGSIPSLINTILVFMAGALLVIAGTIIHQTTAHWAEVLLYGLFWLATGYWLQYQKKTIVRDYYTTNAFFSEFFRENLDDEIRESMRTAEQLWWAPAALRPHVWQLALQTDRIVPAGRALAIAHAAMLFLAYQKPETDFLFILWLGFALLHHLFIPLSAREEVAPGWLEQWIAGSGIMTLSRAWMQLRWVVPLLIGMNIQHFIFGVLEFRLQVFVIVFYIVSAFVWAGLQHMAKNNFKPMSL